MANGSLEVHAGDFKKGNNHHLSGGKMVMDVPGKFFREKIRLSEISELTMASEEEVKRVGGSLGWGLAGGVLLGPVGLIAGLLAGGRGKDVTFVCRLKDGRKFMATASSKTYTEMLASMLK